MSALFQLTQESMALNDLLDSAVLDSDPEAMAAVDAWFREIRGNEAEHLDQLDRLVKHNEMEAAASTAESEQWAQRATVRANRVKWIKAKVFEYLKAQDRTEAHTSRGRKFRIQNNGGNPPVHVSESVTPDEVDPEYVRVVKSFDAQAILAALKEGKTLTITCADGSTLQWAELLPRGQHLRIV